MKFLSMTVTLSDVAENYCEECETGCGVYWLCQRGGDDTMTVDRLAILSTPRAVRLPDHTRGSSTLRRDCSISTQSLAMSRARRLVSHRATYVNY